MSLCQKECNKGGSVMIWAGIVNQTIGPFKVDEGVELNSANYCDFNGQDFLCMIKVQVLHFHVFIHKSYFLMYLSLPVNTLSMRDGNGMA